MAVIDSYVATPGGYGGISADTGSFYYCKIGQSFTVATAGYELRSAAMYARRTGTVAAGSYLRYKVYGYQGTPGTNAYPAGPCLAESDPIDVSTMSTTGALVELNFTGDNIIKLDVRDYILVAEFDYGNNSNCVQIGIVGTNGDGGNDCYYSQNTGTWYADNASEPPFYVYGEISAKTTFHNNFKYRKQLTVDSTKIGTGLSSELVPILISHTDADLKSVANGGKVSLDPVIDIKFENTSGEELFFDLVNYDATTGYIEAWLRVPLTTSTSYSFYIYFGKSISQRTYEGIKIGIKSAGSLAFARNWYNGSFNRGELQVNAQSVVGYDGGSLDFDDGKAVALLENSTSYRGNKGATTQIEGFLMWTSTSTNTRFGQSTDFNQKLIGVFRYGGQWYYDANGTVSTFTPVSTDVLVAKLRWNNSDDDTRWVNYLSPLYCDFRKPDWAYCNTIDRYDDYGFGAASHLYRAWWHMTATPRSGSFTYEEQDMTLFSHAMDGINMSGSNVVTGKVGNALQFNRASSQYTRSVKSSVIYDTASDGQQSVEAWINLTSNSNNMCIIGRRDATLGTSDTQSYMWFILSGVLNIDLAGSGSRWNTGWSPSTGTWYHVAVVIEASNVRLYVNGNLQATLGLGGNPGTSANEVFFGASNASTIGNYYDGKLDEVVFTAQTFSAGRVKTHYNSQNSPSTFYSVGVLQSYIAPADLAHSHALDGGLALAQNTTLSLAELAQAQGLDAASLIEAKTIALADLAHVSFLEAVILTQKHYLQVDGQSGVSVDYYYFDASLSGPSNPDVVWLNESNAFDGNPSSNAIVIATGSTSSNYLYGAGTNAPSSGGTISQVRVRIRGGVFGPSNYDTTGYFNGQTIAKAGDVTESSWLTLTAPGGGWTWADVQELDVYLYRVGIGFAPGPYASAAIIDVEVTSSVGSPITHSHTLDAVIPVEHKTLAVNDSAHSHILDAVTLAQTHPLSVAELLHSQTLDATVLLVEGALGMDSLSHSHSLDAAPLTQKHVLSAAALSQAQTLDSVLPVEHKTLALVDMLQAQTLEGAIILSQAHQLAVTDALHAQTLDSMVLSQKHVLGLQDALHAQAVEEPEVTKAGSITVESLSHSQAVENILLSQAHMIAVADLMHSNGLDALSVDQYHQLVVADMLHSQTVESPAVNTYFTLAVQELLHSQILDATLVIKHVKTAPRSVSAKRDVPYASVYKDVPSLSVMRQKPSTRRDAPNSNVVN